MDEKVWQEFYCHRCAGGGYILVKLNMALNRTVAVVCPMCGARHQRRIRNGLLHDDGKLHSPQEEVCPPRSAWSKEPRTKKMAATHQEPKHASYLRQSERGGVPIHSDADLIASRFLTERRLELHGGP